MFKKRAKRADSQVDWVMSLGIFLLYIAWFFIFIKPQVAEKADLQSAVQNLESNFLENITWTIDKAPVFIDSSIINQKEPIIADFPYEWDNANSYLYKYFIIDNGKLFFLHDLNASQDILWMIHSDYVYNQPFFSGDLNATETQAKTTSLTVNFANSLLQTAEFSSTRIYGFNIFVNGISLNTNNNSFSDSTIAGIYKIYSNANNTHYVFSNNNMIYSTINNPSNTELYFNIDGYPSYYVNEDNYGSIDYNSSSCTNLVASQIDFYGATAMAFIFNEENQLSICPANGTIDFRIDLSHGENTYKIILHNNNEEFANYTNSYSAEIGFPVSAEGISFSKINQTFMGNYTQKKSEWLSERDFNIKAATDNSTMEFGLTAPTAADVYASELKSFMLDEYADKQNITINIRLW